MELNIDSRIELNNGIHIPIIGLGTWMLNGKSAYDAVSWALKLGYRLIDTATIYRNEREVGESIHESGISREDIFITTKVWKSDQGYDNTIESFNKSLKKLGVEYIDLTRCKKTSQLFFVLKFPLDLIATHLSLKV